VETVLWIAGGLFAGGMVLNMIQGFFSKEEKIEMMPLPDSMKIPLNTGVAMELSQGQSATGKATKGQGQGTGEPREEIIQDAPAKGNNPPPQTPKKDDPKEFSDGMSIEAAVKLIEKETDIRKRNQMAMVLNSIPENQRDKGLVEVSVVNDKGEEVRHFNAAALLNKVQKGDDKFAFLEGVDGLAVAALASSKSQADKVISLNDAEFTSFQSSVQSLRDAVKDKGLVRDHNVQQGFDDTLLNTAHLAQVRQAFAGQGTTGGQEVAAGTAVAASPAQQDTGAQRVALSK
jgi:hypothetical protein